MNRRILLRSLAALVPVLLAAGCVTETPEEPVRRSFTWVSDATTTRYTEKDARDALVLPVDYELPADAFVTDALSFTFYPGAKTPRDLWPYRNLTIAVCRGLGEEYSATMVLDRPDRIVLVLRDDNPVVRDLRETVERGRPWGYVTQERHYADYYESFGCMNGRRWRGTGVYPDEFLAELLERIMSVFVPRAADPS